MVQPPSIYVAAGLEQVVDADNLASVDILDILETSDVALFSRGVGSLLRDNDAETAEECVCRGVTAAAVCLPSGDHNSVDSELSEDEVERSAEECAVGLLRDDDVAFLWLELIDDLCAWSALDCVRTPNLELLVHFRSVAVICIDHRDAICPGFVAKFFDRFDDVIDPWGSDRARNEVIEHVNDDYSKFFHLSFYLIKKVSESSFFLRRKDT